MMFIKMRSTITAWQSCLPRHEATLLSRPAKPTVHGKDGKVMEGRLMIVARIQC